MKNLNFENFIKSKNDLSTYSNLDIQSEIVRRNRIENPFPLHVFHPNIKSYINFLCSKDGYDIPPSFIGTTLLSAYSTAIGTSYVVSTNGIDCLFLVVWAGLIGISSCGKSLAIKKIYEPIFDIQDAFDVEWDKKCSGLNEGQLKDVKLDTLVIRDVHIPTLTKSILPDNPKGIVKHADELLEWINGLNQLSKKEGTDEQFYLSTWNCTPYTSIRAGKVKSVNRRPFVNIIGGTQHKVLPKFFDNNRDTSGFIFRLLFATHHEDLIAKPNPTFQMPYKTDWYHYESIKTIYHSLKVDKHDLIPKMVIISKEASELYENWVNSKIDSINIMQDIDEKDTASSILGKIKEYVLRFCGILAVSDKCLDAQIVNEKLNPYFNDKEYTGLNVMKRAIELGEYYNKEAILAYEKVKSSNVAPQEVILAAKLFKQGNLSNLKMAKIVYANQKPKSDPALAKQMERDLKKWMIKYTKIFGANIN